jgi:hypothetical protein
MAQAPRGGQGRDLGPDPGEPRRWIVSRRGVVGRRPGHPGIAPPSCPMGWLLSVRNQLGGPFKSRSSTGVPGGFGRPHCGKKSGKGGRDVGSLPRKPFSGTLRVERPSGSA